MTLNCTNCADSASNVTFKHSDPLRKYPLKAAAYSNELGTALSDVFPTAGTILWAPALLYFGADIYDKWKNEGTTYNPSKRRGVKEAIFQACASIFLPTAAISAGQRAASSLSRFSDEGLSSKAKEDVLNASLNYMKSHSLHSYEGNPSAYTEDFVSSIKIASEDARYKFETFSLPKKILSLLNPFKDIDGINFSNSSKLSSYAMKQAQETLSMRKELMKNIKPKQLSESLFEKFQMRKIEYKKVYPPDKYLGKAAKSILEDYHKNQIFRNKLAKTLGGFAALVVLAKPIDLFVENVIIKKAVEPSIQFIHDTFQNYKKSTQPKIKNEK